jgi:hypothetical protein
VHLDGYDQTDLITGKGPSTRHEVLYFTEGTLSAVRIDDFKYRFTDQPGGWLGGTVKVDWPILTNLRLDPYERTNLPNGAQGSLAFYAQKEIEKVAQTAIDFPPMQKGASLEGVKSANRESDCITPRLKWFAHSVAPEPPPGLLCPWGMTAVGSKAAVETDARPVRSIPPLRTCEATPASWARGPTGDLGRCFLRCSLWVQCYSLEA